MVTVTKNKKNKIKRGLGASMEDTVFDVVNTVLLVLVCVVTLYPFWNTIAVSFNDAMDAIRGGIFFWPRVFSFRNYEVILRETPQIPQAVLNSALRAVLGTLISLPLSMSLAYALSRADFVARKLLTRVMVVTMYVSAGLIPTFLTYRAYGLMNNFMVYILPTAISAFNVLVMRSYISGIPFDLVESAKLDGASEYRILFQIIFPLSLPVIATIGLFVSVSQWNQWFDTMIYCSSKPELTTLQFELKKVLDSAQNMVGDTVSMEANAQQGATSAAVTPTSLRAAMTVVSVIPIACVYPFVQRYFVQGLTLGAVKG